MIQRIQTLYLLLTILVLTLMIFLPLVDITAEDGSRYMGWSMGLTTVAEPKALVLPAYPLLILLSAIVILLLICIFLYKNRKLQLRISVYTIILEFGLIGLMYYYWATVARNIEIEAYFPRISILFPAIAIIFNYLAFRGIRRDELLIRSLDRLR